MTTRRRFRTRLKKAQDWTKKNLDWLNPWLVVLFTGLIFITTVVYTVVSLRQYREAIKTREIETRAFITIKNAKLKKTINDSGTKDRAEVEADFTNTGRSPAKNISMRVVADFHESDAPEQLVYQGLLSQEGQGVVANGRDFSVPTWREHALTEPELQQVRLGKFKLYVWGTADYDDMFDNHWTTRFCVVSNGVDSLEFGFCTRGNEFK